MRVYGEGRPTEWTASTEVKKLGETNYKVKDSSGNEAHRHVDQLNRPSHVSAIKGMSVGTARGLHHVYILAECGQHTLYEVFPKYLV